MAVKVQKITKLPTPPSSRDSLNFNERADNFVGALPGLCDEINQFSDDISSAFNEQNQAVAKNLSDNTQIINTKQQELAQKVEIAKTALNETIDTFKSTALTNAQMETQAIIATAKHALAVELNAEVFKNEFAMASDTAKDKAELEKSIADSKTEINQSIANTKAELTQSINTKANSTDVVKLSGNQTIAGTKTFSSTIAGSINGNAATVTNGVYTTGNQTIAGTKTFSALPVCATAPTANNHLANKKYVDDVKTALNTAMTNSNSKVYVYRSSGTFTAPKTGYAMVICVGGGSGANYTSGLISFSYRAGGKGGSAMGLFSLTANKGYSYIVGAGGAYSYKGGDSSFNGGALASGGGIAKTVATINPGGEGASHTSYSTSLAANGPSAISVDADFGAGAPAVANGAGSAGAVIVIML